MKPCAYFMNIAADLQGTSSNANMQKWESRTRAKTMQKDLLAFCSILDISTTRKMLPLYLFLVLQITFTGWCMVVLVLSPHSGRVCIPAGTFLCGVLFVHVWVFSGKLWFPPTAQSHASKVYWWFQIVSWVWSCDLLIDGGPDQGVS